MIMKLKLLVSFALCPLALYSQSKISGTVLDKETHEPIPFVVIYTNNQSSVTDEQGRYHLMVERSDSIYFKHLAYNFYAVSSNDLLQNDTVNLIPHTVELTDVTISPIDALSLLKKAGQNLNKKLKEKDTRSYLFHVEESNTLGKERELYALIDVAFKGYNPFGKFYMWDYNLSQLDKVKTGSQESFYGKIRYPMIIRLFPFKSINPKSGDFIYSIQDIDSNYFILKATPTHPNIKHYSYAIYTINKQDTVPVEITFQSVSDSEQFTRENFKDANYERTNVFSTYKIVKDRETGYYYFKEVINMGSFNVKTADSDYKIDFQTLASLCDKYPSNQINTKKKIGIHFQLFDYALFETDFPNSPGFWKQYVTPQ